MPNCHLGNSEKWYNDTIASLYYPIMPSWQLAKVGLTQKANLVKKIIISLRSPTYLVFNGLFIIPKK